MKKKIFIITIWVMGLFAVQGYAQRERGGSGRNHRVERPVHRNMQSVHSPRSSVQRNSPMFRNRSSYRPGISRQREQYWQARPRGNVHRADALQYRRPPSGHYRRRMPPPPNRIWHPVFRHHHGFRHYHHHCHFSNWYWYRWGGYYNRFICHRWYRDRFFDSLLGYYIWGTIDAPTRLEIGDMILTRYDGRLKVQIGNNVSYFDLYRTQTICYKSGYTSIEVTTGNGSALVRFYDDYGNEATYCL